MSLLDRIKNIITELPYGIRGIPLDLFEPDNLTKVYLSLSEREKNKLNSILLSRKEKFFMNLLKKLK